MTPEEQAAADAAAAAAKAAADAGAKDETKDAAYWEREAKKAFADRDTLKIKVKELTPAAQRLKEIEDANKTEVQRLADENAALKPQATRAAALEAQVQAILDTETASLTDAQRAAIVGDTPEAKLAHLRALQAAGMIARPNVPVVGANLPGAGGAGTITQSAYAAITSSVKRAAINQAIREERLKVIPG